MNEPLRVFFDFEFTGLHQRTTPISLGCVCDSHISTFYAEFTDYDVNQVTPWVRDNVISRLCLASPGWGEMALPDAFSFKGDRSAVATAFSFWLKFVHGATSPNLPIQMWGDVLAYDWVLLRELLSPEMPRFIYYIPFDLSTLMLVKKVDPDISRRELVGLLPDLQHNALQDAAAIHLCYQKLMES